MGYVLFWGSLCKVVFYKETCAHNVYCNFICSNILLFFKKKKIESNFDSFFFLMDRLMVKSKNILSHLYNMLFLISCDYAMI